MHPDLERSLFIEHLSKLQQEVERLALTPAHGERGLVSRLKAQIERLESQNAVLRARMNMPAPTAKPPRQGCRYPNVGLGSLSYDHVAELHRRQLDSEAISAAAGVNHSTLSRWRKANGYVLIWIQRLPAQEHIEGDPVGTDGGDDGQPVPVIAQGHRRP